MQNQLLRVFEIDRRVRAKKKPTPEDLARDLKVSRRQIFYDRNRLIELGAPLEHENGGWVYRDASFVLPTSILTEGELLAVEIARAVDAPYAARKRMRNMRHVLARHVKDITRRPRTQIRHQVTAASVSQFTFLQLSGFIYR